MNVLVMTFPPSKNFENYLKNFIQSHFNIVSPEAHLGVIIRYTSTSLTKICKTGPRGRVMTFAELEQAIVT